MEALPQSTINGPEFERPKLMPSIEEDFEKEGFLQKVQAALDQAPNAKASDYEALGDWLPEEFSEMYCECYLKALKADVDALQDPERIATYLKQNGKAEEALMALSSQIKNCLNSKDKESKTNILINICEIFGNVEDKEKLMESLAPQTSSGNGRGVGNGKLPSELMKRKNQKPVRLVTKSKNTQQSTTRPPQIGFGTDNQSLMDNSYSS